MYSLPTKAALFLAEATNKTEATNNTAQNATKFTFEEQVISYSSLYLMAIVCIIWGTIRSLAYVKAHITQKELIETSITTREAKKFPITASIALFTLYLIFKTNDAGIGFIMDKVHPYVSPTVYERLEWAQHFVHNKLHGEETTNVTITIAENANTTAVNATLFGGIVKKVSNLHPVIGTVISKLPAANKDNLVFLLLLLLCWEGCVALACILKPLFSMVLSHMPVGDRWPRRNVPWMLVLKRGKKPMKEGQLEKADKNDVDYFMFSEWDTHLSIAMLCCSAIGISHLYRRHWITNNLLGMAFSIFGIEFLHLASFKAGVILLSGLFIYDVFWVFATDVMTTVAKSIDAPILLMFPQDLLRNGWLSASKHGMLGLGDIVIPGIFVALLYRFDHYVGTPAAKNAKGAKSRFYCWVVVFAYAFGLLITMGVMHYFKAAQPALLYLVPSCIILPLLMAVCRGELRALWNYSEEHLVETEETKKKHESGATGEKSKKKKGGNNEQQQQQENNNKQKPESKKIK